MNALRRLHEDEEGFETLQAVIIIGIAAIVLGAIRQLWPRIRDWFRTSVDEIIAWRD
jgi:hypothetical protein